MPASCYSEQPAAGSYIKISSCTPVLPFALQVTSHLPVLFNCYQLRSSLPFRRLRLTHIEAARTRLSHLLPSHNLLTNTTPLIAVEGSNISAFQGTS